MGGLGGAFGAPTALGLGKDSSLMAKLQARRARTDDVDDNE
jgi:hypothetical protein